MNLNKLNINYVLAGMFAFLGVVVLVLTISTAMVKETKESSDTVKTVTVVKTFTIVTECHDGVAYYNRTSFILYEPNSSEPVKCDGSNATRSTNILDEQVYSLTNS